MIYELIRLTITNTVNDDEDVEWYVSRSESDKYNWIHEKKDEQEKWNYDTPGAVSMRYYQFCSWTPGEISHLNISELTGMTVEMFKSIILNI